MKVAELADRSRAAIASRLAAEIYGLEILAEDIEDEAHNTTRFIVLAREPRWPPDTAEAVITTFVFRVRTLPAALYKALGGFATNGVNMTKLESYMVDGNFFATQFYADVEGHPHHRPLGARREGEPGGQRQRLLRRREHDVRAPHIHVDRERAARGRLAG